MRRLIFVLLLVAGLGLAFAIAVAPAGTGSLAALTKPTKRTTTTVAATTTTAAATTTTLAATTTTAAPTTTIAPTTTVADTTTTTELPTTTTEVPTTTEPPTTTTEPPTTTGATTTTVAPTTTTTGPPPPPPLRFPRPASYATAPIYYVTTASNVVNVPAGTDANVKCADPVTHVPAIMHKRPVINGGRDVYVVGCDVDVNQTWPNPDDQNAVGFGGQTRLVWFEGVFAHGDFINDGLKGCAGAARWVAQNDRIGPLHGSQSGYHSDVFQPYCGFTDPAPSDPSIGGFDIDNVTGMGEFQCLMVKSDSSTYMWNETNIGRLDCHDTQAPGSDTTARLLNLVTNGTIRGPIHYSHFGSDEFFIEPRPNTLTDQNAGNVDLKNSIAPAACFVIAGTVASPTQVATPISPAGSCLPSDTTLVSDGHVREMQQQEAIPNTGWFEYVPASGNVGLGYVLP
jgi:hypothetical protein